MERKGKVVVAMFLDYISKFKIFENLIISSKI